MRFNVNIIKNILETHFQDEIDDIIARDVQNMDGDELGIFEADEIGLSAVLDITVDDDYEVEENSDGGQLVSGTLEAEVDITTLCEGCAIDSGITTMVYSYSFTVTDETVDDLYMEWVD